MTPRFTTIGPALVLALLLVAAPGRARADFVYDLSIDTSSISGTPGYLDLQLNPAGAGVVTATVDHFLGDAGLGSFSTVMGDVTGAGAPIVFSTDGGQVNETYAPATFGVSLGLTVTLSSADASSEASFQVTLYDSNGNPLTALRKNKSSAKAESGGGR